MTIKSNYKPPKKILLDNGIRIIAEEVPGTFSCAISIWIDTGSANEELSNHGVTHFIEHIVFKGTKTRSALNIAEQSENVGANLNAFTDREHTCYHARVLSEYVSIVIELFLDMLFNPKLQEDDMELERQVILEEIKMYEDTPEDLVQDLLYEVIWKGHSMGRPITGTVDSITKLKKDEIIKYLHDFYTPDNIVISVAGKFNLDEIIKQTEDFTKNIKTKRKKKELPPLIITPDIFLEYKETELLHLSFATQGVSVFEEDRYTLAAIDSALGGGMSSRLFQEIREKRGLVYSISSYYNTNKLGGLFGVYAGTTNKDSNIVIDLILKELKEVKKKGLKPDELERAKMQLKASLLLELESTKVRAFRNALYDLYYNRFISPDEINESVHSITNERIINLTDKIFDSKYFTLTVVGPKHSLSKGFKLSI